MATQIAKTRIKVNNPSLENEIRAYLAQDSSANDTTINTIDNTGFTLSGSVDYYILIGEYGAEKSEIVLVDASASTNTLFTVGALKYSHEASEPVTYFRYNQIQIFGATTSGGTKNLIDTIDIDPTQQFTEYTYSGSTYSYFYTDFYNSNLDTISDYSDEITASDIPARTSVKRIINSAARKALVSIDQNPESNLNWDIALEIIQDGSDEILARKRKWSFLRAIKNDTTTVKDQQYVEFPNDYALLEFIMVNGLQLKKASRLFYNDYTANGGTVATGKPSRYTFKNDKIYLMPTPDSAYDIIYEYYKVPAVITSDLATTIARPFVPILIYYCAAHFAWIKGNDKRGDKMYKQFEKLLEDQVVEYSGPEDTGQPEEVERTSIYGEDDNNYIII